MDLGTITAGRAPPWDINVVVEIPLRRDTVVAGAGQAGVAAVYHPGNYGFVPDTRMPDGEPCVALVVGSFSVLPGAILRSRPIGMVELAGDEGGGASRLLAVPLERLHPFFADTTSYRSLPAALLDQIERFLRGFLDERPLRVTRWGEAEEAARMLETAIASHRGPPGVGP